MRVRSLLSGAVSLCLATTPIAALANDDVMRALGLGLSIMNNVQQQQQQQQRQQQQPRQQQSRQQTQSGQQTTRPAAPPVETVAQREQREQVRQTQELLNTLGYDAGPVDGDPGPRTRNAIAAFRRDFGLAPGERVDAELVGALAVARRTAPAGSGPAAIGAGVTGTGLAVTAAPAVAANGVAYVDGRLAVATDAVSMRPQSGFDAITAEAVNFGMQRFLADFALASNPNALATDDDALALLVRIPHQIQPIIEAAIGRPLDRMQLSYVERATRGRESERGAGVRGLVQNLNPFERRKAAEAVRARAAEIIPPLPVLPTPVRVFCEVELGPYDLDAQIFPIASEGCTRPARGMAAGVPVMPASLPMPMAEAETFVTAHSDVRAFTAFFDASLEVSAATGARGVTVAAAMSGPSPVQLLRPGSASVVLLELPAPDGPEAVATGAPVVGPDGLARVGDRLAVMTDSTYFGSAEGFGPALNAISTGLSAFLADYALASHPDPLATDDDALALLSRVPDRVRPIIQEATGGRPLDPMQEAYLERLGKDSPEAVGMQVQQVLAYLNPFERRKAAEAVRALAAEIIPQAPASPAPIRVFCEVRLGSYDLDSATFPIASESCRGAIRGLAQGSGLAVMPTSIPMPWEEAEAFVEAHSDAHSFVGFFDASLELASVTDAQGTHVSAVPRDPSGVSLLRPGSASAVLLELPGPQGPVAGALPVIDLQKSGEKFEALLALAGPPQKFPADGRALIAVDSAPIAEILGFPANFNRNQSDSGGKPGDFHLSNSDWQWAERVATALGTPRDRLIGLGHTGYNEEIAAVFGLLPAPAADYATPPAADFYGDSQIAYQARAAVRAVHAFVEPSGATILVAVLQPVEASFSSSRRSGDQPRSYATFDLAAVPAREWAGETLAAPSQLARFVHAADSVGGDPAALMLAEGVGSELDVFARQDMVNGLVTAARAMAPVDEFWMAGEVRYSEYAMDRQVFPASTVQLGPIDVLRADDFAADAERYRDNAAFDLPMSPDEARAWVATHGNSFRMPARARVRSLPASMNDRGQLLSAVEVLEFELLDDEAVATVRDPAHVLRQVVRTAAAPAPEAEQAAPTVARDVLGVTLGMPLAEAAALVRSEITPTAEFVMRRDTAEHRDAPLTAWDTYVTADLYFAEPSRLSMTLYSEPPTASDVVTGVLRAQTFEGAARPHPDALHKLLVAKYGPAANDDRANVLIWLGVQDAAGKLPGGPMEMVNCINIQVPMAAGSVSQVRGAVRQVRGGNPPSHNARPFVDAAAARWTAPDAALLDLRELFSATAHCPEMGEVLVAVIVVDDDGMAGGLQLALSAPGMVGALGAANEQLLIEPDPAVAPMPEIKL